MKLTELAAVMGVKLVVTGSLDTAGKPSWSCSFENTEIKTGACLTSTWGAGNTPQKAMKAYAAAISNQTLIVDAYRPTRRSFNVLKVTL